MNAAARQFIAELRLERLPGEGGFFRQTARTETVSAILFLMTADEFSALHRLAQDELWHFHAGDPVEHVQLDPRDGAPQSAQVTRLGADLLGGEAPQVFVPAGVWQGARLAPPRDAAKSRAAHGYALVGCTASPPWEERGFELAARASLRRSFPPEGAWIDALTR